MCCGERRGRGGVMFGDVVVVMVGILSDSDELKRRDRGERRLRNKKE